MEEELKQLYDEMKAAALRAPRTSTTVDLAPYRRTMESGLRLVFYTNLIHWKLSVYQAEAYPAPGQIKQIRRVFSVPDLAKDSRAVMRPWHIIRFEWPATEQTRLFEVGPSAKSAAYYGGEL